MQLIEIQKGVQIGFDDMVQGAAQMETSELEKFTDQLSHILARRKTPSPSERELALISKIYETLQPETQKRYDGLQAKLSSETISETEYNELLGLTKIAEEHNVHWLQAVVELAQLRNVSPQEVIRQLGLNKRFDNE
jgi:hypothetical protein